MNFSNILFFIRSFKKYLTVNLINIFGLAIGYICFILIALYVIFELKYDTNYKYSKRLFRVTQKYVSDNAEVHEGITPYELGPELKSKFDEIENYTRLQSIEEIFIQNDSNILNENNLVAADSNFFKLFTCEFISGDPNSALKEINNIVITESVAKKMYGNNDPIGKPLIIHIDIEDSKVQFDGIVTAIIKDPPQSSHFHYRIIIPTYGFEPILKAGWCCSRVYTYILLKSGFDIKNTVKKFPQVVRENLGERAIEIDKCEYVAQNIEKIHLHSDVTEMEFRGNGNNQSVIIFTSLALLILIISALNFINLSSAISEMRLKEIGIKKVNGATRHTIIKQLLFEYFIISLVSISIAIIISRILFIPYTNFIDKPLWFSTNEYILFLIGCFVLSILLGLLSGLYPSIKLSIFKPISIIRRSTQKKRKDISFKKVQIVLQFTICFILLLSQLLISKQLKFMYNQSNTGFNNKDVIVVKNYHLLRNKYNMIKEILLKHSGIKSVSSGYSYPGSNYESNHFPPLESRDHYFPLVTDYCDYDLDKTLELKLTKGRFISDKYKTDRFSIVINEATAKKLGWEQPIGKEFCFQVKCIKYKVVGVIQDFHFESFKRKIKPLAMILGYDEDHSPRFMFIKINPDNKKETLKYIAGIWDSFVPDRPFSYVFMENSYNQMFKKEIILSKLFLIFSILGIIIASLGILGLLLFSLQQKRKEVALRKTLGANVINIVILISKQYYTLILIASFFGGFFGYLYLKNWLQNYEYQCTISVWMFIAVGIFITALTSIVISFNIIKTANANPTSSLAYE